MKKETIKKYQHFLQHALLIDQSRVVDSVLTPETYVDHMNNIYNGELFEVKLSSGPLTGTLSHLQSEKAYIIEGIQEAKQKIESITSIIEKNNMFKIATELEEDVERIEAAVAGKRYIYYWLLVPYWMAKELKEMDEVVFEFKEAYYWGVTALSGEDSFQKTLYEIFEEINFEKLKEQFDEQETKEW